MTGPISRLRFVALGALLGGGLGAIAGLAEAALLPLGGLRRFAFVVGADGCLGLVGGVLAAVVLSPFRRGRNPVTLLVTLLSFFGLAAALGWIVNRVILPGVAILHPISLAADLAAIAAAAGLAVAAGRIAGSALASWGPLRRPLGPAVAVAAASAAALALPLRSVDPGEERPDLPDILLVSIDTLRPDCLSIGGHPGGTSPMLDRLCRQGTYFSQALAVSPGSAASHAALFTARYPVSNGVWTNFAVLSDSVTTVAEWLREKGYRTGGFATNTFLGKRFQFDQGFDSYVESGFVERLEEASPAVMKRSLLLAQIVNGLRGRLRIDDDPSFEAALEWVRESRRPTFFFVHLMDVHSPYVPSPPFGEVYGARPEGVPSTKETPNRFGWRPSVEAYLAEIRFADTKIRRLVRTLEARGRLDDTIVLLTSDHGENLLDHEPNFTHGINLFDATVLVLGAIRAPAQGAPVRIVSTPVENVDFLPTVARLLGWKQHPEWEGSDALAGGDDRTRWVQLYRNFAARTSGAKTILNADGTHEHYDLAADPGETEPVEAPPGHVERTERALREWLDEHATDLYLEHARTIDPEELDAETVKRLRALGYVE